MPARLVQTGPLRGAERPKGMLDVIDLDLRRYDALQSRFDLATREHAGQLKAASRPARPPSTP